MLEVAKQLSNCDMVTTLSCLDNVPEVYGIELNWASVQNVRNNYVGMHKLMECPTNHANGLYIYWHIYKVK